MTKSQNVNQNRDTKSDSKEPIKNCSAALKAEGEAAKLVVKTKMVLCESADNDRREAQCERRNALVALLESCIGEDSADILRVLEIIQSCPADELDGIEPWEGGDQ